MVEVDGHDLPFLYVWQVFGIHKCLFSELKSEGDVSMDDGSRRHTTIGGRRP